MSVHLHDIGLGHAARLSPNLYTLYCGSLKQCKTLIFQMKNIIFIKHGGTEKKSCIAKCTVPRDLRESRIKLGAGDQASRGDVMLLVKTQGSLKQNTACDLGLTSTSDFEVEFDWDEALQNLDTHNNLLVDGNNHQEDNSSKSTCIFQRLKNLHKEETSKRRTTPRSQHSAHLLDKLVQKEKFNMVLITLHPSNKGYSLGVCMTDGKIFQESRHPYSQDLLLDYIDKEELPPPFLDYWDKRFPQLFYSGAVIVKLQDLRYSQEAHIRHLLLRPHTQSIVNDVNLFFLSQNQLSSAEDKILVESTVVNSVQNPLCLSPSLESGLKRYHSNFVKNVLNTVPLRNVVLRNSQLNLSRKRGAEDLSRRHLSCFIAKKKEMHEVSKSKPSCNLLQLATSQLPHVHLTSDQVPLGAQGELNLLLNQALYHPGDRVPKLLDYTPKLIGEYIFEPYKSQTSELSVPVHKNERRRGVRSEVVQVKLEISQEPDNFEYVGTLHMWADQEDNLDGNETEKKKKKKKNNHETDNNKWSKCSFTLGSETDASRYIEHFKYYFTKEQKELGRSVKISHILPDAPQQPIQENSTSPGPETSLKTQGNVTLQNNGKAFVQIASNTTIGNNQQCSFKNSSKISVQQLSSQNISGKSLLADCSSDGTIFNSSSSNTILSKLPKSALVNNVSQPHSKNLVQKQKLIPRKMSLNNSKIRAGLSSGGTTTSVKLPISPSSVSPRGSEQVLVRGDLGLHSAMSMSAISSNFSTVNTTLRNLKPGGVLRNVGNVHSVSGTLDGSTGLQTSVGLQTVHLIAGGKERSVTSNGQNPLSSLSRSLPGLTALLADSSMSNSQILKKTNTLEPPQQL